jgi:dipeptidase D
MQIRELEPKEVFYYFEELSKIPRGSGHTEEVAEYCLRFAEAHGLKAKRDAGGNVLIYKGASDGCEEKEPVILQGHLDMVCEKEADCEIDMERQGLELETDGEKLWAAGTSLGADDGIALAYSLALLASDKIAHPPIEALFTNDEETGMLGARQLDGTELEAKRLINIDSETEGILYVSCAGGVNAVCEIPVVYEEKKKREGIFYELTISNLAGGHSGIEIHKQRVNAIRLLASLLSAGKKEAELQLAELSGGGKDNAIPKEARALFQIKEEEEEAFLCAMKRSIALWLQDMADADKKARIYLKRVEGGAGNLLTKESTEKVLFALEMSPDGLYKRSEEIDGMTESSLNLGIANLEAGCLRYTYLIRSNKAAGKALLLERLERFTEYLSGRVETKADYPAWEYCRDSELREICRSCFRELYGYEPEITSIHAGLECGIFAGKKPELDMISFGPTMQHVHTSDEVLDVASAKRCWDYLLEILKRLP